MNKAAFPDRDGTIAEDANYCRRVEDFHIPSGTAGGYPLSLGEYLIDMGTIDKYHQANVDARVGNVRIMQAKDASE